MRGPSPLRPASLTKVRLGSPSLTWEGRAAATDDTYSQVRRLMQEGCSQQEVVTELSKNRSTINRHWNRARMEGGAMTAPCQPWEAVVALLRSLVSATMQQGNRANVGIQPTGFFRVARSRPVPPVTPRRAAAARKVRSNPRSEGRPRVGVPRGGSCLPSSLTLSSKVASAASAHPK